MILKNKKWFVQAALVLSLGTIVGCDKQTPVSPTPTLSPNPTERILSGASSYTPYDAHSMIWSRGGENRNMVWTASGAESCKLLVSKADTDKRPDWALCSQGVVSALAAKGEKVVIIATVYVSDDALLPVFRKPKQPLAGSRTLPIPRSSIEFALDNLLKKEGVKREALKIPKVEKVGFPTIATLLSKPSTEKDALDFAILVEPFITTVVGKDPNQFEIGKGGIYQLQYSLGVRESDLKAHRDWYVELLRQILAADQKISAFTDDATFYKEVWGRQKDGKPELLPPLLTYKRQPAKLQLRVAELQTRIKEELEYLTKKYPDELKMPANINALVDPSLLKEIAPERVTP